jgi:hypothetical protein
MRKFPRLHFVLAAAFTWLAVGFLAAGPLQANPDVWRYEWPKTDFEKTSVDFDEIMSGGPPKDGIPSIDNPEFLPVSEISELGRDEPVIGLVIDGKAKAYPLRILTWHEIVNDEIAGVPVAVTYCPLCNSAIVFDRRVDERVLEFGVSGKLRNSDMVMYDRNTQSWWQQFLGEGIVGELMGVQLEMIPARLESWSRFAERHPDGRVLVPNNPGLRPYGANPYVGYDTSRLPFLYRGEYPEGIEPMERVVAIGEEAWALSLLQESGRIETDSLVLRWEPGQNSALDTRDIDGGRDVGNVVAQRKTDGGLEDVAYDVTFAFVFHAFRPEGTINK